MKYQKAQEFFTTLQALDTSMEIGEVLFLGLEFPDLRLKIEAEQHFTLNKIGQLLFLG